MRKTRTEVPSNAQQNGIGIDSTNSGVASFATEAAGKTLRTTSAAGALGGRIGLNPAAAFTGESPGAIRAVSFRGPTGAG